MTIGQRFAETASQTTAPDLSILLVSHGHGDFVRDCLASLDAAALHGLRHEVIVLDNLHEPDFATRIGGLRPGLILLHNTQPVGFGENMNKCAEIATGRVLLILNPDTAYHAGDLAQALRLLEDDPACGIVAARLVNEDGSDQRNFRHFPTAAITALRGFGVQGWARQPGFYRRYMMEDRPLDGPTEVDWVYGSFMLIRRSTYAALGGFDPGYFMYYEDVDLCLRLRRAGLKIVVDPQLQFLHHHQRSSAQRGETRLRAHHLRSFRRYLWRSHACLFPPATSDRPDPVPQPLRGALPFLLAAAQLGAVWLAGGLAAALAPAGTGSFHAFGLGLLLVLAQYTLAEYAPTRLGDTPRRVIGVLEGLVLASLPWILLRLIPGGAPPSFLALAGFLALAALLAAGVTYAVTLAIPATGLRMAVVTDGRAGGLAQGLGRPVPVAMTVIESQDIAAGTGAVAQAIAAALRAGRIDAVLLVLPEARDERALRLVRALSMFDLPIWHLRREPGQPPDRPILLRGPLRSRTREGLKRGLDLLLGLSALAVLALPMLIVAALIKLEDGGPVFFAQPRDGRNQQPFAMLKFRTMKARDADRRGDLLTLRNDARITRIGAFLRKTSIDELPQLFNVVAGHMSIVGPRPLPLHFHFHEVLFEAVVPDWHHRHRVKPGITGLSQLRGLRGTPETADGAIRMMTDRGLYDNLYIDNWTIWLDLRIIVMTLLSGAFMAGAY